MKNLAKQFDYEGTLSLPTGSALIDREVVSAVYYGAERPCVDCIELDFYDSVLVGVENEIRPVR